MSWIPAPIVPGLTENGNDANIVSRRGKEPERLSGVSNAEMNGMCKRINWNMVKGDSVRITARTNGIEAVTRIYRLASALLSTFVAIGGFGSVTITPTKAKGAYWSIVS